MIGRLLRCSKRESNGGVAKEALVVVTRRPTRLCLRSIGVIKAHTVSAKPPGASAAGAMCVCALFLVHVRSTHFCNSLRTMIKEAEPIQ